MSIRIDAHTMRSNITVHYAEFFATEEYGGLWSVSWLPGCWLTRSQAHTAMVLAETVTERDLPPGDRMWLHVDGWAAELDLTGPDAVVRVSEQTSVVIDQARAELAKSGVILRRIQKAGAR